MKTKWFVLWAGLLAATVSPAPLAAQSFFLDCSCLAKEPALVTNACQAVIPDLCQFTNCWRSTAVPPPVITCSQTPPAGTPVGPGVWNLTLILTDSSGQAQSCQLVFTVNMPAAGCGQLPFSFLCASNKTVECGTSWSFDPPGWTNACAPPAGTVSNGVVVSIVSTITNGFCPQVITRTWQGVDDCGVRGTCSQTVTVVDTTPPSLNCNCLTNPAVNPAAVSLVVTACTSTIPDLCLAARICAIDKCGPLSCSQTPLAGTPVGPGNYPITLTVSDCASNTASCTVVFSVVPPAGGCNPPACVNPPPGMAAWWPLDETAGATLFVDATGNGNTALVESGGPVNSAGSPTAVAGKVLGANYFYGLSPRGRALNAPLLNFGQGSFSADCWVNPVLTGTIHWHPIIDKLNQTTATTGLGYSLGLLNTKVVLKLGAGTLYTYTSVGSVTYGAWNFVAVAVDRTANSIVFNVNGVPEAPQAIAPAGSVNNTLDLLIGSTYNGSLPLGELAIDELELFGRVLATNEMNGIWAADRLGKCKTNSCIVSIFCRSNIVTTLDCTQTCATVAYSPPLVANGLLTGCTPPSGSCFPQGVTPVICTAASTCGAQVACQFSITVNPPTNCPPCPQTLFRTLNTGTTSGGALLPTGAPELAWVNLAAPGGPLPLVVIDTNLWPIVAGPWLAPSATSAWVGPNVSGVGPVGLYTNRWTFDAPCTNVCLRGRFASDDAGYLYLNGVLIAGPANYAPWVTVNVCSGFSNGVNKLELVITNAFGPTGFRTELEVWTQCCTPCVTTTNVFNTGMGGVSGNVPLPASTPDPNYTLVSAPPGGCNGPAQVLLPGSLPAPPWVANGPNSQWIGGGPTASCQGGVYRYRLCFYIPCTEGASITGLWTADDWAVIHLNGVPTNLKVPSAQFPNTSFAGWHPVKLTNGFVCGQNCLDFYVTNAYTVVNPTGFRAQLTNVFNNCCCEPSQTIFTVKSGQSATGPLPVGAPDTQLSLSCAPQGVTLTTPVVVTPNPYWAPNGPTSQWVGPSPNNSGPAGLYCYTLSFNLPPCTRGNPAYTVKGRWMGDDAGQVYLNGLPTGFALPIGWAFTNWHPINITSGLLPGLNTLTFYVTNASAGSTGIRLELTASGACCDCAPRPCSCNFTNGGFDQSVPVNGTGGGWTSSGLYPTAGWQASGGNPGGTFLLNNLGAVASDPMISQQLCCLVPGQCYTIRGDRKVQAWYGQTIPSFAVLVDGVPILALPVPTNPADNNWHPFAVSFTATKTCQTIAFAAEYKGSDVSYWLDNLRLECCNPNCRVTITCPPNQVYLTCKNSALVKYTVNATGQTGPVVCTPPSATVFPLGTTVVVCTATNSCGAVANCSFTVTVKPPPNRWDCYHLGLGIPFSLMGGATAALRPDGEPGDPAITLYPDPADPASGVLFQPGSAQALSFTATLDFTAPAGAGIDLVLPVSPLNPSGAPLLSFRNTESDGYCVRPGKRADGDPSALFRASAVSTDGQLLDSLVFTPAEIADHGVFFIRGGPDVALCHVTIELDCRDGTVSVEFSGPVTPSPARKGWDGSIYGPDRPIKRPVSRIVMTPSPSPGETPVTDLFLLPTGMAEVSIEDPAITTMHRRWGDGHVTLMKAYDDGDSIEFAAVGDGGGVQVDLGHTESFSLRLTKFETNALPGEELLTRTLGPIRGLTNRPPPPFLDALLFQGTPSGIDCSADFSNIDAPTVRVEIFSQGELVASRSGLSGLLGTPLFTLPGWPSTLGTLAGPSPCRTGFFEPGDVRLPAIGGGLPGTAAAYADEVVSGNEFRITAELADDAPRPDNYSAFEFVATEGADWGLTKLARTLACPATLLNATWGADSLSLDWLGENFRLQGAERVTGPWFDLGASSPVTLPVTHPARYFRLVCD